MARHACGCVTEPDADWGVIRSISKCRDHTRSTAIAANMDLSHYAKMSGKSDGEPGHKLHIDELLDPLAEMRMEIPEGRGQRALEIGCGLGLYAPLFLKRGYQYEAIEPSAAAAAWTRNTFDVTVRECLFEQFEGSGFAAVMAAHVFEHLTHAPVGITKVFDLLNTGGFLCLLIPDDSDLTNPDHYWFFTTDSLYATLARIGFVDIRTAVRKRVPHENFIYCTAIKPSIGVSA